MNELATIMEPYLLEAARETVRHQLLNGSQVCEEYGIARSSLKHITPAYEPGKNKPRYRRGAVEDFIKDCESH